MARSLASVRGITQTPFLVGAIGLAVVLGLWGGFMQNKASSAEEAEQRSLQVAKEADGKFAVLTQKMQDLAPVLGFAGSGLEPDPTLIKAELDKINTAYHQPPIAQDLTCMSLLNGLAKQLDDSRKTTVQTESQREKLRGDVKEVRDAGDAALKTQQAATAAVRAERDAKGKDYDKLTATSAEMEGKLRQQLDETRTSLEGERKEKRELEAKLKAEVALLKTRITELAQVEERRTTDVPDGQVVRGLERDADPRSEGHAFIYVDIGRVHGVKDGTKFSVFSLGKGGQRTNKGTLVVKKALDDLSECAILELHDPRDPIVRGDFVANKFFEKNAKQFFALVGNFDGEHSRHTKEEWKRIVTEHGHVFQDSVRANTTFVILGDRPTEDSEQWRMRDIFKVEGVTEQEVLSWFDYGSYTPREGSVPTTK